MAILRKTNGPDFRPSVLYASPARVGENLFALGFPAVVDQMRGLMNRSDRAVRVVRTEDEIITIYGDDDRPTHYVSNVSIAPGNSGGPMVDECGQVVSIATWGSTKQKDYRGGASSLILMRFLRRHSIPFVSRTAKCQSMVDYMRKVGEQELADTSADRERLVNQRSARALALREARERARDAYTEASNLAQIHMILLLFGIGVAGAVAFAVRSSPLQRKLFIGALAFGGVMAAGLVMRLGTKPALSDFSAPAKQEGNFDDPTQLADGSYVCKPDLSRSRYLRVEPEAIDFTWRSNGCVGSGRQYTPDGSSYEAVLLPDTDPVATHFIFDPRKATLISTRYDLNAREAAKLRQSRPDDVSCTADSNRLRKLARNQQQIEAALPALPNERIVYTCK